MLHGCCSPFVWVCELVGLTRNAIDERTKDDIYNKYEFVTFGMWAHHIDYLRSGC